MLSSHDRPNTVFILSLTPLLDTFACGINELGLTAECISAMASVNEN